MLATPTFNGLLRQWRDARRLSQLDLALSAEVSPRHLSCLETGKARPGRELVLRIAETLEMPLRDRNALLLAAGYAPIYSETELTTPELVEIRRAIELLLAQQEPFPASVLDRHWNILQCNAGFDRIIRRVLGGRSSRHTNMIRQIFDPEDVRRTIVNWEEVAASVLANLQHTLAVTPQDATGHALVAEVLDYPGVPRRLREFSVAKTYSPLLTTVFCDPEGDLSFFSTITTFAMPRDITLDELRIECCFPTDDRTREICRAMTARAHST